MNKKLIAVLLIICFSIQASFAFAASYELLPYGDGRFEFSGNCDDDADTTLIIWSDSSDALMAISQINAGSGRFSEVIDLGSADDAVYSLKVNGGTAIQLKNITTQTAVSELSDASSDTIVQLLRQYRKILGIDTSRLDVESLCPIIAEAMADETFSSAADATEKYELISGSAADIGKAAAFSLIADGKSAEALEKYISLFDVDKSDFDSLGRKGDVYAYLNGNTYNDETFKAAFADALIIAALNEAKGDAFEELVKLHQNKIGIDATLIEDAVFSKLETVIFESFEKMGQIFINENSLCKLNQATRETIQSVLEAENDTLGILDTNGYSSLTASQKQSACMALAGGDYATVEAAKSEFVKIIASVKNSDGDSNHKPSGSSSGGGSFGFSGGTNAPVELPDMTAPEIPFKDVPKTHWGYSAVAALYNKGIVSGTTDTTFTPNREVTREEFVKMLVGTFGLLNSEAKNPFADIPSGDWCEAYVASAFEAGLTNGRGDGTFGKGDTLTRQDMAVLAARCASIAGLDLGGDKNLTFADEADFAAYATNSIYTLAKAGIINGVGEGIFSPGSSCTRVMAAKVCSALLDLYKGGAVR
ncbi:MAG: S-layer homology domain-containing protein [Ruminococcaceae bacterium]|nr:S-layer homology domain-containing protein [Oscillospiraceae bacterium]